MSAESGITTAITVTVGRVLWYAWYLESAFCCHQ